MNQKGPISKSDILARIEGIEERTVWNDLFGDGELKGVRENFRAINKIRNKVMHHRTISAKEYDEAKELLTESTGELETYANHIHEDPSYPKRHSANALSAARLLGATTRRRLPAPRSSWIKSLLFYLRRVLRIITLYPIRYLPQLKSFRNQSPRSTRPGFPRSRA